MIILNGKKFAQNDNEFTDSLFNKGGTCVGYYRKYKKSISLLDHNKEKVGIINSDYVLAKATKQDDGRYWYSFANPSIVGEYDSYIEQQNNVQNTFDGVMV